MEAHDEELVKALAPGNAELHEAYVEHARLKKQVKELAGRQHLSPAEELEKKKLQKEKLAQKTKILKFLEDHRKGERTSQSA